MVSIFYAEESCQGIPLGSEKINESINNWYAQINRTIVQLIEQFEIDKSIIRINWSINRLKKSDP